MVLLIGTQKKSVGKTALLHRVSGSRHSVFDGQSITYRRRTTLRSACLFRGSGSSETLDSSTQVLGGESCQSALSAILNANVCCNPSGRRCVQPFSAEEDSFVAVIMLLLALAS